MEMGLRCLLVAVALAALVRAAPRPDEVGVGAAQPLPVIMITQSPAQAIEDAIRYDPDVAAALQSNATQLYLLKSVTYSNGTAEDLGLPKEQLLPEGAPDRVRIADKIVYPAPTYNTEAIAIAGSTAEQQTSGVHATLQLVPVPIN